MSNTLVWYLLYGGSSVDGAGFGVYVGRTTDESNALAHLKKVRSSPYSTGYVLRVDDRRADYWWSVQDCERKAP